MPTTRQQYGNSSLLHHPPSKVAKVWQPWPQILTTTETTFSKLLQPSFPPIHCPRTPMDSQCQVIPVIHTSKMTPSTQIFQPPDSTFPITNVLYIVCHISIHCYSSWSSDKTHINNSTTCDDTSTPSDKYFIYWEGLHKHCLLLNPFMLYIYIIEYIHIKPKHFILLTAVIITTTTPNNTHRTTDLSTCTCYISTTSSSSHLKQDFNPTTTKSQHHPRKVWWKNVVQF